MSHKQLKKKKTNKTNRAINYEINPETKEQKKNTKFVIKLFTMCNSLTILMFMDSIRDGVT